MSLDYASEKFNNALNGAVSSRRTVQGRLADAFIYEICRVEEKDVPHEIWSRTEGLMAKVTCKEAAGGEGTINATTSQMTEDEASDCLKELVDLKYRIDAALELITKS